MLVECPWEISGDELLPPGDGSWLLGLPSLLVCLALGWTTLNEMGFVAGIGVMSRRIEESFDEALSLKE